ncbi:cysteine desulfurase family protein [Azospirillum rugosum]|uniref:Cysteine desulfurase n=1 Tax=Azospirillum rugosum TaxID=416170 RepID=A0ABS4SWY6_9PROT|nr:cysteine desulfurase family protein [Azospirillum rugosum]MBP2297073.1 cysteine desulfurase [Azospirillum rugosum]MDQ0530879.1 cysteine desulfurase [Azospirillum rugosum]
MNMRSDEIDAPIFLDGFATLPLAPEARAAMLAAWELPGNAGSPNGSGERAARIVEDGRSAVADLIGAAPAEIVFTSGATEANNLAILGVAAAYGKNQCNRRRIVISAIEHKAVIEPVRRLEAEGFAVTVAPVHENGHLDLNALSRLIGDDVLLASVMLANNEIGVIQPVREVAQISHAAGALFHCDAAQAAGKIPIDVLDLDVDYLSLSGHKCYGPMGIGALYLSAAAPRPTPQIFGGGQQGGVRSGTEPVALIAGFGAAARVARSRLPEDQAHGVRLIAILLEELARHQLRFTRVSGNAETLPGSAAIMMPGVDADMLCATAAREVSLSTGSACTSGQIRVSHVLEAIGFSDHDARSVVRIFCNRYTTETEVVTAAHLIADAAKRCWLATGELRQ